MVTENKGRERQRGRWRRAVKDLTGERYQILRGQQSALYSGREAGYKLVIAIHWYKEPMQKTEKAFKAFITPLVGAWG